MMKQITLTDENYRVLMATIDFALDDAQVTGGRITDDIGEQELLNLEAAVKLFTRDVATDG
jgi:hypothetical protein